MFFINQSIKFRNGYVLLQMNKQLNNNLILMGLKKMMMIMNCAFQAKNLEYLMGPNQLI